MLHIGWPRSEGEAVEGVPGFLIVRDALAKESGGLGGCSGALSGVNGNAGKEANAEGNKCGPE